MAQPIELLKSFATGQGAGFATYYNYASDHDANYVKIEGAINQIADEVNAIAGGNSLLSFDLMTSPANPSRVTGFVGVNSFAPTAFISGDTQLQIPAGVALTPLGRVQTNQTFTLTGSGSAGTRYAALNQNATITIETATDQGLLDLYSVTWDGAQFTTATLARLEEVLPEGHDLANLQIQEDFGQGTAAIPAYSYDRIADRVNDIVRILAGGSSSSDSGQAALGPKAFAGSVASPGLAIGDGTTFDLDTGLYASPASALLGVTVNATEAIRWSESTADQPQSLLRAGTALATPPLGFIGDPDSGLAWVSANRFRLVGNATSVAEVRGDVPELFVPVRLQANADAILGDPGLEAGGISVNGTSYDVVTKISEIGSGLDASLHYHKHSNTIGPIAVASRSRGTTSSHTVLQDGDELFRELITGRGNTTYEMAGYYRWVVDSTGAVGALGDGNMPARYELYTTPPDTDVPVLALTVSNGQVVNFANTPTIGGIAISTRETLTANRDYFVSTTGSDSNDGLSSGAPFLTIQHAIDVISELDLSTFTVTINLATGTYAGFTVDTPFVGSSGSSVILDGDTASPGSYVISSAILAKNAARISVQGIDITSSGQGLHADGGLIYVTGAIIFGATTSNHMFATNDGGIFVQSNYTIDGNAVVHMQAINGAQIEVVGRTVTLTGTPAFSSYFAGVTSCGTIAANANTYSGSATGKRYFCETNGAIFTGGAVPTYFPGTILGTQQSGGRYVTEGFREVLTANRTYYVNGSTGADTDDGLTSANAFLTLQHAIDVVAGLDLSIYAITIQLDATGTYAGCTINAPFIGGPGSQVTISGSTSSPGSYVISSAITVDNGAALKLNGLDFTSSGKGIDAQRGARINVNGAVIFGACSDFHCNASQNATIKIDASYTIDGSAPIHWSADSHGSIICTGVTITLSGTPNFSSFFARAYDMGLCQVPNDTFSGSATGQRYTANTNGTIAVAGAATTYLPGDVGGSTANGGVYA